MRKMSQLHGTWKSGRTGQCKISNHVGDSGTAADDDVDDV